MPIRLLAFARRPFVAAVVTSILLAGCASELERARAGRIYAPTLARMDEKNIAQTAPVLIRVFKESRELEVWKQDRTGRYRLLKTYPVCYSSGVLGPKKAEGDRQAPEGFYDVKLGQMNPHSIEHLSFNLGYPNAFDRSLGRTGDSLMIHGGCRSVGCYAMTNEQIEEIYRLVYDAFSGGQEDIQIQALPFRMTDANMEAHKDDPNMPFWRMLKRGSDLFEATASPPRVNVCDGAYVFTGPGEENSCTASAL